MVTITSRRDDVRIRDLGTARLAVCAAMLGEIALRHAAAPSVLHCGAGVSETGWWARLSPPAPAVN